MELWGCVYIYIFVREGKVLPSWIREGKQIREVGVSGLKTLKNPRKSITLKNQQFFPLCLKVIDRVWLLLCSHTSLNSRHDAKHRENKPTPIKEKQPPNPTTHITTTFQKSSAYKTLREESFASKYHSNWHCYPEILPSIINKTDSNLRGYFNHHNHPWLSAQIMCPPLKHSSRRVHCTGTSFRACILQYNK